MKRCLVFGARGFVGSALVDKLRRSGHEVIGITTSKIDGYRQCDLTNERQVAELIMDVQPESIYNCSGSYSDVFLHDAAVNVVGVQHLLDAVRRMKAPNNCRVLLLGTSAEYGIPPHGVTKLDETMPLRPVGNYGLTKVIQYTLMHHYVSVHRLDIVMARLFNLEGAGTPSQLLPGQVRRLAAEFKAGHIDAIRLGDLTARRDYINVVDAVAAMQLIMQRGQCGCVYNVGSGVSIPVSEIVFRIIKEEGVSPDAVFIDCSLASRSANISDVCADISRLLALEA
jgi:nucleoside-diphosphate-sugar epimerase